MFRSVAAVSIVSSFLAISAPSASAQKPGSTVSTKTIPSLTMEIPYGIGPSAGPFHEIADPELEADYHAYALAHWQRYESEGSNTSLFDGFEWSEPINAPGTQNFVDPDPFGAGRAFFRVLYAHRLSLGGGPGHFDVEDLVASDAAVAFQWKHWTLYRQFITNAGWDPVAHGVHVAAVNEAQDFGVKFETRGIPLFTGTILVSDRTTPKKGNGNGSPPVEEEVDGLAQKLKELNDCLETRRSKLEATSSELYEADGAGNTKDDIGFDCDDFADAIGAYLVKGKEEGVEYHRVLVTWTTKDGKSAGHLVTKVSFCGHYWLVDAQTGRMIGPFADATEMDAQELVKDDYDVDGTKAIDTEQDERKPNWRPEHEPPPWHEDEDQKKRFEDVTGFDADCFVQS